MVRNLLGYPVILFLTLYLGILNRLSWVLLLFFAEFFLFFLQILGVFYQKRSLVVTVEMPVAVVLEKEPARMRVVLKNAGYLPVQRAEIRTEYRCLTGKLARGRNRKKRLKLWGNVDSWGTQSYEVLAGPFPGGQFRLSVPDIRIYDYFGIFSLKLRVKKAKEVAVLPSFLPIPAAVSGRKTIEDGENDWIQKGQDLTELFDIREYQAGDNPRHIYWKRSAGRETLLYREGAQQAGVGAVIFLELLRTEGLLFYYLLKLAGSLMYGLLEEGCMHFLVWEREEVLERRWIRSEQEIYEAVTELLEADTALETGRTKARKTTGWKKEALWEGMEWQEKIRLRYGQQFPGEELPEPFFILCRKLCRKGAKKKKRYLPALILMQEEVVLKEFLKDRKLTGEKEELALLEKEMREC